MLSDADGHFSGEASEALKDADALFRRLKLDVKADYNSTGQVNWRREAREDFDFEAGEQLNEEDKLILQDGLSSGYVLACVAQGVAVCRNKGRRGRLSDHRRRTYRHRLFKCSGRPTKASIEE
jgi:hypothetical protein